MSEETSDVNEAVKRCATEDFDSYEAGLGTKGIEAG